MSRTLNKLLSILFLCFFILSCQSKKEKPDVSSIPVDIKIERFDREIAALKPNEIQVKNTEWQQKYNPFYADYMQYMLKVSDPRDSIYLQEILKEVIQKKDFIDLAAVIGKKYPDLKTQEEELTQAFRYIKHYFPQYEVPRIISFFSGFEVQVPIGEKYIGVGLDMFLGNDSPFYPALIGSIPLYVSRRFTAENITPRIIEAVIREELFPVRDADVNTLQQMIYHGKVLYAMDQLTEVADSLKIGYTSAQLAWAQQYQKDVWQWFLQEDLLYSTDYLRTQKYFTEAPFTPELGSNNESAPKLGSYIGWQIVRKYMSRHPEKTLVDLLKTENAQEILEDSKFKGD